MYLNYKNKRKFDELVSNSQYTSSGKKSNSNKLLKQMNKNGKGNGNGNGNGDADGDSNGSGDGKNNLLSGLSGLSGLFENQEENIYINDNHLYFHTDVDEESVDKVKKLMRKYWDNFNTIAKSNSCGQFIPKPLYIHIFSPGGCIYSGLSLYDFIIEYKKKIPIYTVVEGRAASAATFLSIAGTKRFITPNSYILIHQLSTFFGGNYQQIEDEFINSKKCMEKIIDIYTKHTKINKKKLPGILKHDINWDANECIKNGLVDEIKLVDVFNDN